MGVNIHNISSHRYEILKKYLRSTKIKFKYITDIHTIMRDGMIFLPMLVINGEAFDYASAVEYIKTKGIKNTDKVVLYGIPNKERKKYK